MGEIQKNKGLAILGTKLRGSESGAMHYCSQDEKEMRGNGKTMVGGNRQQIPQSWGKLAARKAVYGPCNKWPMGTFTGYTSACSSLCCVLQLSGSKFKSLVSCLSIPCHLGVCFRFVQYSAAPSLLQLQPQGSEALAELFCSLERDESAAAEGELASL